MAKAPLIQLQGIELTFGGGPLFEGVSTVVHEGARAALVGRNGSGKSTLLKVMAGLVEPDKGSVSSPSGISVGYMEQDPTMAGCTTLGDFAISTLGAAGSYKVERAAEGLGFDPDTLVETASGGERRRAAMAKLMAEAPDLMLLDEPTNHLDIAAIAWLENALRTTRSGMIMISHDRAFLRNLARTTLWLDRGVLRQIDKGVDEFESWRDKTWAEEDDSRHKLDRKIKAEARWAVEGISARRKRNMGRVRALQELRAERKSMIRRQGAAAMGFGDSGKSGRRVIEATELSKAYDDRTLIEKFSLRVARGDRVAFVGPNGAGKTTLLKMLIGEVAPDEGKVVLGTSLEVAVFDQARAALRPDLSLWENLTGDPTMRVSGRSDQVMVRGQPRHVVGYLKDFLFSEAQARAPVRSLSGGERARLLLARLMAQPANLLVLDEPTNDLDVETLDLLVELVADFSGTVLVVSHDRDFVDRVATLIVDVQGNGRATVYAGGWSDMQAQRQSEGAQSAGPPSVATKPGKKSKEPKKSAQKPDGLTFTERHRLEALPAIIERLTMEIDKLEALLSDPELFTKEPVKFQKATDALVERQKILGDAEDEWLVLEEKSSA